MSINERFDRLDTFITENRLVRTEWGDGQEHACLLHALAPEVKAYGFVDRCPASLLPPWLAELTPNLDDNGTEGAWPAMVRRYSHVVRRGATTLDDVGWRRVLARFMIAVLAEAAPHDPSGSCQRVAALWVRVLSGEEPPKEEWEAARTAASFAVSAAARAAARTAAEAAEAAAWDAVSAAADAATAAVAAARATAWVAARTAARTAAEATWDCITVALLDGIELECGASREETK